MVDTNAVAALVAQSSKYEGYDGIEHTECKASDKYVQQSTTPVSCVPVYFTISARLLHRNIF